MAVVSTLRLFGTQLWRRLQMPLSSWFFYSVPLLLVYCATKYLLRKRKVLILKDAIRRRENQRSHNFDVIRNFCVGLPSDTAAEIASWSYEQLKERLQDGQISCVDALRAYHQRALKAHEKSNCICLFIEEAMIWAKELDAKAADPAFVKPPLFGIPVSIKECIRIKGYDTTLGYAQDLFNPSEKHSAVVAQLLHLGAVPFCHTNNPLSLCAYGCTNAIYGRTTHPQNPSRVPGGSSGGEAALIALGASTLGIGSDIGGSIRIPSSFCGIAGFKPSVIRFSHLGSVGGVPGRQAVIANEGPMAQEITTCVDYLRNVWGDNFLSERDPFVPPVKWQDNLFTSPKPLTIGYYKYDGFFKAAPAYERVVTECVQLLQSAGHTLVEFEVPNALKAFKLMAAAILGDGGVFLNNKLDNDIVPSDMNFGIISRVFPIRVQRLLGHILPWRRLAELLSMLPMTCPEMREVYADIDKYRTEFIKRMKEQNIDVLISPPMVTYPTTHDFPASHTPLVSYTSIYNVLDFAAGVVPFSHVTEEDEAAIEEYPLNDPFDRAIRKQLRHSVGLPVGIQVAAPPFREEMALRVLCQISKLRG